MKQMNNPARMGGNSMKTGKQKYRLKPAMVNGLAVFILQKRRWPWGWVVMRTDNRLPVRCIASELDALKTLMDHLNQKPIYNDNH